MMSTEAGGVQLGGRGRGADHDPPRCSSGALAVAEIKLFTLRYAQRGAVPRRAGRSVDSRRRRPLLFAY